MKTKKNALDFVKANRKGSRDAELEISPGWSAKTRVHKSKKQYNRKDQNWKSDFGLFYSQRLAFNV